jgi:hypothetical protein
LFTKGGENKKGFNVLRFLRLMPKGERVLSQSKRTAPPPIQKISSIFQNWYFSRKYISIGIYISNWYISQNLLKAKRRISFRGSFVESKEKHLKQERKFQILKMLLEILFIYLWLFAKRLWKDFPKEFAKTKQVVQMWSKILKQKKAIHAYLVKLWNWFNSK